MTAVEDRLAEIEARALNVEDVYQPGDRVFPRDGWQYDLGVSQKDVPALTVALRAVLAIHSDGRFADEIAHANPPYCLEGETDEYPCTTRVAIATAWNVTP